MSVTRVLTLINGIQTEVVPATTSAGSSSAGQVVALNTSGLIDSTMLLIQPKAFVTLTDSSAVTWAIGPVSIGNATLTMSHTTATRTITLSGMTSGTNGILIFKQDSTGGATATLAGGNWYVGGSSGYTLSSTLTLTTTANAVNVLAFFYDGTNFFANLE